MKLYHFFVKNHLMFNFYLYDLKDFGMLKNFIDEFDLNKTVILCIGTKKMFEDSFGVLFGDRIKSKKLYCFGSSKREINGTNFLKVYDYVRNKYKDYKILVIDSVYVNSKNKPILIYQNFGVKVSGLNNDVVVGDAGILFNAFSYNNYNSFDCVLTKLEKLFEKNC